VDRLQPVATINYPNDYEFTRVTEFKQMTGQKHSGTSLVREYPQAEGEPYYPLAEYRYYNMDQVVAAALKGAKKLKALLGVDG